MRDYPRLKPTLRLQLCSEESETFLMLSPGISLIRVDLLQASTSGHYFHLRDACISPTVWSPQVETAWCPAGQIHVCHPPKRMRSVTRVRMRLLN